MSQPKRYSVAVDDPWFGNGAYILEDGKYVLYSDYAALAAENERLRMAGDRLASATIIFETMSEEDRVQRRSEWLAAKEGRGTK